MIAETIALLVLVIVGFAMWSGHRAIREGSARLERSAPPRSPSRGASDPGPLPTTRVLK